MVYGPYPGVVGVVHDGDTVHVRLDLGFDIAVYTRVRVYGVNAPELATAEGKDARAYVCGLLPEGATCLVRSHGWDKYGGRIDGDITLPDGRDLATVLLNSGHAVPYHVT